MIIIKYLILSLSSLIIYRKIINNKYKSFCKVVASILFSIMVSYSMLWLVQYIPNLKVLFLIISSAIFMSITTKCKFDLSLTVMIISFGVSYTLFMISIFVSQVFTILVIQLEYPNIIAFLIASLIQAILLYFLFRLRRLKNGLTFLKNIGDGSIGTFLSCLIILFIILMGIFKNEDYSIDAILVIGIGICIMGVVSWWRNSNIKSYKEILLIRENKEAQKIIDEKNKLI